MELGEQGGSELRRQNASPLLYGADGAEKPLPRRVGHDESGNAGPDKPCHVSLTGIESQDDHHRVPGSFPHLPEGLFGLRRDGQDLEPGPGADQGGDAGRGRHLVIEQNQRDAGGHESMFAVDGEPDNPSQGPLETPSEEGRRGECYDSGSFFLPPEPWVKATTSSRLLRASFSSTLCTWLLTVCTAMCSRTAISLLLSPSLSRSMTWRSRLVSRTASSVRALLSTGRFLAIWAKRVLVSAAGSTSPPPATARMVAKKSSNEASFMMKPDAPARTKSATSSWMGRRPMTITRAAGTSWWTVAVRLTLS